MEAQRRRPLLPPVAADEISEALARLTIGPSTPASTTSAQVMKRAEDCGASSLRLSNAALVDRWMRNAGLHGLEQAVLTDGDATKGLDERDFFSLLALDVLARWGDADDEEKLRQWSEKDAVIRWAHTHFGVDDELKKDLRSTFARSHRARLGDLLIAILLARKSGRAVEADADVGAARAEARLWFDAPPEALTNLAATTLLKAGKAARLARATIDEFVRAVSPRDAVLVEEVLAGRHIPVVITGPSGSGKSRLARMLSNYAGGPYQVLDCGVHELFDARALGTRAGMATDARDRDGALQLAHGGTLHLEELQALGPRQVNVLLGALGDDLAEFTPLGGVDRVVSEFRRVSTSTDDALQLRRSLGDPLWFRLEGYPLALPAWGQRSRAAQQAIVAELCAGACERAGLRADAEVQRFTSLVGAVLVGRQKLPGELRSIVGKLKRAAVKQLVHHDVDKAYLRALFAEHPPQQVPGRSIDLRHPLVQAFRMALERNDQPTLDDLAAVVMRNHGGNQKARSEAVRRRLLKELGVSIKDLREMAHAGQL